MKNLALEGRRQDKGEAVSPVDLIWPHNQKAWTVKRNCLLEWLCHSYCVIQKALFTRGWSQLPPLKLLPGRELCPISTSPKSLKSYCYEYKGRKWQHLEKFLKVNDRGFPLPLPSLPTPPPENHVCCILKVKVKPRLIFIFFLILFAYLFQFSLTASSRIHNLRRTSHFNFRGSLGVDTSLLSPGLPTSFPLAPSQHFLTLSANRGV